MTNYTASDERSDGTKSSNSVELGRKRGCEYSVATVQCGVGRHYVQSELHVQVLRLDVCIG